MNGCRRGELSISIDHLKDALTFGAGELFSVRGNVVPDGPQLQVILYAKIAAINPHSISQSAGATWEGAGDSIGKQRKC